MNNAIVSETNIKNEIGKCALLYELFARTAMWENAKDIEKKIFIS
jgi:hypothetical protein